MIKLRATWNIPGGLSAEEADAEYFRAHVPAVRSLDGLVRHGVLKFLRDARGGHPAWWRGEELWFDDVEALDKAAASGRWAACWNGRFAELVAGPRIHVFTVVEEFQPPDAPAVPGPGTVTALSGIWQIPAELTPADVDHIYLDVHVPGVRRLPRLRRHSVMTAVSWPAGEHARAWRSAEIRFDSLEDFDAVFDTPQYEPVRQDGFNASIAGPDVDIYSIEEEWTPGT